MFVEYFTRAWKVELEKQKKGRKPSFRWALTRAFGLEFAKQAVLILVEVILTWLIYVIFSHFALKHLKALQVLFSPMVTSWVSRKAMGQVVEKFSGVLS